MIIVLHVLKEYATENLSCKYEKVTALEYHIAANMSKNIATFIFIKVGLCKI